MSTFYSIDSANVSHREYWWGTRSPAVLIGWITKWLRIRLPSSSDDPNTESTVPFLVEALPEPVTQHFAPLAEELAALGFIEPIYHVINDTGTATTIYWATFRDASGQYMARIHQRIWNQAKPPDRGTFVMLFAPFADGRFATASSGKPDMDVPSTVTVLRRQGAPIAKLWQDFHQSLAATRQEDPQPVLNSADLIAATERYHILVRDFHLARGVFRVRSGKEEASAAAVAAKLEEARTVGLQNPEVVAEVERIQVERPGWGNALVILVISAIAFLAAGSAQTNWKFVLWLIPLLLFHECGHWLAMKVFGYRNLRMFFIPFFGAAVTGQNWNVPGWKKAMVSLAGPVPGIVVGVVLGIAGLITGRDGLSEAAFLLLLINGFNLLPVLPLDGGHVLHAILFCRNRWLDIGFRMVAIVGLLLLGLSGTGQFMIYIGVLMAIGLPVAFKVGKVADDLKRAGLPPPGPGEDRIPMLTADTIVTALKAGLPPKTNNKTLALHTVNVFETLNAHPPGILGTLGLGAVHGGSLLVAVLFGFLLILNKHGGGLRNFAQTVSRQPTHEVGCASIQSWSGSGAISGAAHSTIIATPSDRSTARRQFDLLTRKLPVDSTLVVVGESLLLTLPAGDDAARERWFSEFQTLDTNTFVALSNQTVTVSVMFVAPTAEAGTNLVTELQEYLHVSHYGNLISPWSSEAAGPNYLTARRKRRMWDDIGTNVTLAWSAPAVTNLNSQVRAARKRGSVSEADRLTKEQAEMVRREQSAIYKRLLDQSYDPELIDLYAQWSALDYTNRAARTALGLRVSAQLGEASQTNQFAHLGVTSGFASNQGLLVEIRWIGFKDISIGLPSLIEWLCRQRGATIKYDIIAAGAESDDSID